MTLLVGLAARWVEPWGVESLKRRGENSWLSSGRSGRVGKGTAS